MSPPNPPRFNSVDLNKEPLRTGNRADTFEDGGNPWFRAPWWVVDRFGAGFLALLWIIVLMVLSYVLLSAIGAWEFLNP